MKQESRDKAMSFGIFTHTNCISLFGCFLQLAAIINDSAGVIATNTAAIQLASARDKPW